MGHTIVVGVDGSSSSLNAMTWALKFARERHARVVPAFAWEYPTLALLPFPVGIPLPPRDAMQQDRELRADELMDSISKAGPTDAANAFEGVEVAEPVVHQGGAGRVLCDVAAAADLLVVGSRGRGAVKGVLLGSVSAYCANAAPCPVVVVPETPDVDQWENGVAIVGVDGSPLSDAAVLWADKWVPEGVQLLVVHVWNIPATAESGLGIDSFLLEAASGRLVDSAADLVTQHDVATLRVRGDARLELEKLAGDAGLLVIGARGNSALERILMGSVASHTMHHLTAPTVIVRPPESDEDAGS